MRKYLLLVSLFLFNVALASQCSTTLVGVMESGDGFEGVLANLTVSVAPGSGNVWVDTMPLTKIETQVSARLAREVACELLNIDCSKLDFFYVMRSDHVMVGGPSAGAPMTVCTMAVLLNKSLDPGVVTTGTINPDGSVGPVGGVIDKARTLSGYDKFLIPEGSFVEDDGVSLELIEVLDVFEAFYHHTGYEIVFENISSEELVSDDFNSVMKLMDESLIDLASDLLNGTDAGELLNLSRGYYDNASYYSSASYSVRSLIYSNFNSYSYLLDNETAVDELINQTELSINNFSDLFFDSFVIDHLYDLEAFAVTVDRIREAEELISQAREAETVNDSLFYWSFAETRLVTAQQWSTLLDYFSDEVIIDFDVNSIRPFVIERLEFARNAIAYAQTITGIFNLNAQDHLDNALNAYDNDELVYALFESLKARAEANLMMELRGFENLSSRIDFKREAAIKAISNSMRRGYLPFLSLSFLEYSESFEAEDPYQALLFLTYAKEFSTIGSAINEYVQYSPDDYSFSFTLRPDFNDPINQLLLVVLGFILGLILVFNFMPQ